MRAKYPVSFWWQNLPLTFEDGEWVCDLTILSGNGGPSTTVRLTFFS